MQTVSPFTGCEILAGDLYSNIYNGLLRELSARGQQLQSWRDGCYLRLAPPHSQQGVPRARRDARHPRA